MSLKYILKNLLKRFYLILLRCFPVKSLAFFISVIFISHICIGASAQNLAHIIGWGPLELGKSHRLWKILLFCWSVRCLLSHGRHRWLQIIGSVEAAIDNHVVFYFFILEFGYKHVRGFFNFDDIVDVWLAVLSVVELLCFGYFIFRWDFARAFLLIWLCQLLALILTGYNFITRGLWTGEVALLSFVSILFQLVQEINLKTFD